MPKTEIQVLRRRVSARTRDDLGRKHCARGDKCLDSCGPWLPEDKFHHNAASSDGLHYHCISCEHTWQRKRRRTGQCTICNGRLPCKEHERTRANGRRRTQSGYICTWSPEPEWRGGWFSATEMKFMLKDGSWPEGTRFNHMKGGAVLELVRVIGEQLKQQELGQ